jgi:ribosomal protein L44E
MVGGDGIEPMKTATCLNCSAAFRYAPAKTRGKYCSNACRGEHISLLAAPRVERGEVTNAKTLRKHMLRTRGPNCEECGQEPTWNGKPLVMHMDHVDGNSDNNLPANLRLVCPNCHTQTATWCGRAKKGYRRNRYLQRYKREMPKGMVGGEGFEPPANGV